MSLVLNESLVLAKTRSQDLRSVLKLNCWGSGIKDVSLVRQLVNVEVIGLSCNEITTLEDFAYCTKLKELILRKNKIKNIAEIAHLQGLPKLTSLWLDENPCVENTHNYRKVVLKALPNLTILDNVPVTREELQEIEELGNEIYEEIPYESSNSSSSGPSSTANNNPNNNNYNSSTVNAPSRNAQSLSTEYEPNVSTEMNSQHNDTVYSNNANNNNEQYLNETSYYQTNDATTNDISITTASGLHQLNDSHVTGGNSISNKASFHRSSSIHQQQQAARCLSSQGSVTTLNGYQNQGNVSWSNTATNMSSNNNNILPKGGKSRNGNILSAVLCLVKELDYVSCEVVETALHCRMEETSQ